MARKPTYQAALDEYFAEFEKAVAKALVSGAEIAAAAGDALAQSRLVGGIRWDQVNRAALALVTQYAKDVARGGSLCTVRRDDGTTAQEFVPWLRDYTETARNALVDLVEEHIASGQGVGALADTLEPVFDSMKGHAETIARTEMSRIRNDAAFGRYLKSGVDRVEYLVGPEPCEICEPFAGTIFAVNDAPWLPQHPRCVCGFAPVIDVPPDEET